MWIYEQLKSISIAVSLSCAELLIIEGVMSIRLLSEKKMKHNKYNQLRYDKAGSIPAASTRKLLSYIPSNTLILMPIYTIKDL